MNNDFIKFLEKKRAINNQFYTVYQICKATNHHPTTTVYRKFNRMVAYGLLEYKYNNEKHAILYRRKK